MARDRVALVTGGSRGIGRAISVALAAEGIAVAVNYRADEAAALNTVEEIERAGGNAIAIQADLARPEGEAQLAQATLAWRGRLDYLINNAGMMRITAPEALTHKEFRRILEVNLMSPFALIWDLKQELAKQGGAVINIGSVAGIRPAADRISYCTSKAALDMLTRACALALGPEVRVNCVAPGSIDSAALRGMPEEYVGPLVKATALQRPGQPAEVATVVTFLLSEGASYITGETIYVSGGHGR